MKLQALRLVRHSLFGLFGLGLCSVVSAPEFSANFKGADISEFITTVGRNLNKTMIVDPAVRGKVNVQRFKGLGEMNPGQLRETTMHPDTRRLVQLQLAAGDNTHELMDMLLAKKRAADRKQWLQKNGDLAEI